MLRDGRLKAILLCVASHCSTQMHTWVKEIVSVWWQAITPAKDRSIFPNGSKASTCYLNVLHTFELILNCCAVAAVPFVTPANDRSIFQYRSKSPKSTFNLRNALELISNCRTVTATVRVTPGNDWSPTLNKHNHCSPLRHTILLLHFLLVSVAAVRKDIRPEETCTFRSPTLTKHNHCSPQRHTKLQFDFLLCS